MKKSLAVLAFSSTVPIQSILYQLYGEWSVWHSNLPHFLGPNRVKVNLYPQQQLEISVKRYIGPFLYERKWAGRYALGDTSCASGEGCDFPQDFKPLCDAKVGIEFSEMIVRMISVFGIGVDEVPLPLKRVKNTNLVMDLSIVGRDDMYLTVPNDQLSRLLNRRRVLPPDKRTSYHLVRCVQDDQPRVSVPFSTFVATQLLGTFMGYWMHDAMCR
jgi:hypothetical protein